MNVSITWPSGTITHYTKVTCVSTYKGQTHITFKDGNLFSVTDLDYEELRVTLA